MDNLMLVGAQDQYEAGLQSAEKAEEAAFDAALNDADGFSDWLCADHGKRLYRAWYPKDDVALLEITDNCSKGELLVMLLYPCSAVRLAAATALRHRWLKSRGF